MYYIALGTAPADENCVQVTRDKDYLPDMLAEAKRFKSLLELAFPEPDGGSFRIKAFDHDFGVYYEVCACFNEMNPEAVEWAYKVEISIPRTWKELEKMAKEVQEKEETYWNIVKRGWE